ncbi:MAG TPA: NUDIX hydrolase [Thermohalobaculum sp.]|nr:NUDIX hydrolase [Thermohalobaculum sp.]
MPGTQPPKDAIRDAASVILVRRDRPDPRVLMGQRGKGAAFMPSKFVFPGGGVDREDRDIPAARLLPEPTARRLRLRADPELAEALAMAAIRELWEETGLALAHPIGIRPGNLTADWQTFFDAGHRPAADALEFIFRAITPPGRPRRFDARFFMVDAARVSGDLDDLSGASGELTFLSWLTLSEARRLDLPFITEVVLAEVEARLGDENSCPISADRSAPFFHHAEGKSFIDTL